MIRETGDKTDGSCRAENQLIATLRWVQENSRY
jgi:hypothetical protein